MKFRNTVVTCLLLIGTIAFAADVTLGKTDFVSAKEVQRGSQLLVQAKLSDSGKKKINSAEVKEIKIHIAGVDRTLKQRAVITGNQVEAGPFTTDDAKKIVNEINQP